MTIASICISIIALVLSAMTFWRNYLAPFKPEIIVGQLTFRLLHHTTICSGEPHPDPHWSGLIDMPITIANVGACPGQIHDLRITLIDQEDCQEECYYANDIIESSAFARAEGLAAERIGAARIGQWQPQILLPKTVVSHHVLLSSDKSWYEQDLRGRTFCATLEYYARERWERLESFEFILPHVLIEHMKEGSSLQMRAKSHRLADNNPDGQ